MDPTIQAPIYADKNAISAAMSHIDSARESFSDDGDQVITIPPTTEKRWLFTLVTSKH